MSTDIAGMISHCDRCQFLRASQAAEPLQNQPQPVEPMQSVSMDLYEVKGHHFLVMVDRYCTFVGQPSFSHKHLLQSLRL
jgi:hypothetical protein